MAEVTVREPHLSDIVALAAHMRAADLAELEAVALTDPLWAVEQSVRCSTFSYAALVDGEVACIFGVAPVGDGTWGAPWCLGTDVLPRNRRSLMRRTPHYIAKMLRAHSHLVNFVHAENTIAVAWLKRMGFEVGPAAPYGPLGSPFHRFEMHQHV